MEFIVARRSDGYFTRAICPPAQSSRVHILLRFELPAFSRGDLIYIQLHALPAKLYELGSSNIQHLLLFLFGTICGKITPFRNGTSGIFELLDMIFEPRWRCPKQREIRYHLERRNAMRVREMRASECLRWALSQTDLYLAC